jgi:antitoxin CptB
MISPIPVDDLGMTRPDQPGVAGAGTPDAAPPNDDRRLARLRWRCRRGMLENDLVLARFLDARGATLSDVEAEALARLLDLSDNELWDLISGRADPEDPSVQIVVNALRRS